LLYHCHHVLERGHTSDRQTAEWHMEGCELSMRIQDLVF